MSGESWSGVIMDPATEPGRDPYFHAADVGPDKRDAGSHAYDPDRRRRRSRTRTMVLVAALVSAWLVVLVDPHIGPLVVFMLGAFGVTLGVLGAAMGLGLLGFGLCGAMDRAIGWLRRSSRWPNE
jgi:hypothetical protein